MKAVLFYYDKIPMFEKLEPAQLGRLTLAIMYYSKEGIEPDFSDDPVLDIAFASIRASVDENGKKYEATSASRSGAGKKGMKSRWGNKDSEEDDSEDITNDNKNNKDDNKNNKSDNKDNKDDNKDNNNKYNNKYKDNNNNNNNICYADINKLSGKPDGASDADSKSRKKNPESKADKYAKEIEDVVLYLNEKADKHFLVRNGSTQKLIRARLEEGRSVGDFKTIIDNKVKQWLGTENDKYLRPETLFAAKHFDSYLNENPAVIVPVGNAPPQGSRPLIEDEDAFLAQFR
jgi:uncharacterized phage protein (TIGR02220 family)